MKETMILAGEGGRPDVYLYQQDLDDSAVVFDPPPKRGDGLSIQGRQDETVERLRAALKGKP